MYIAVYLRLLVLQTYIYSHYDIQKTINFDLGYQEWYQFFNGYVKLLLVALISSHWSSANPYLFVSYYTFLVNIIPFSVTKKCKIFNFKIWKMHKMWKLYLNSNINTCKYINDIRIYQRLSRFTFKVKKMFIFLFFDDSIIHHVIS